MNAIGNVLEITEWILLILIGIQVLYFFIFSFAGLFSYKPEVQLNSAIHKIAVIIPAYQEDKIILDTAQNALKQKYPDYRVIICADNFSDETVAKLRRLNMEVLEVKFQNSTKAKSVNKALEFLSADTPGVVVILDADNHMAPGFLMQVNEAYAAGHQIIQGHRTAKNKDSSFALLDSINEEIGNTIFRKGHRNLGLSSALIGSAMAFDYTYLRRTMESILDVAGEDKLLELLILKAGKKIEYLPEAYVLDEKVANPTSFSKQRTRWVGVQIYFLRKFFLDGLTQLFSRGNIDYFDKAFQMALIPKVLLIGFLGLMAVLSIFTPLNIAWLILCMIYFLALLLAIPRKLYNADLLKAIVNIPVAVVYMMLAIFRINKKTASTFERTEKSVGSRDQD